MLSHSVEFSYGLISNYVDKTWRSLLLFHLYTSHIFVTWFDIMQFCKKQNDMQEHILDSPNIMIDCIYSIHAILPTTGDIISSRGCELLMGFYLSCHWVSLSHLWAVMLAFQHKPAESESYHKHTPIPMICVGCLTLNRIIKTYHMLKILVCYFSLIWMLQKFTPLLLMRNNLFQFRRMNTFQCFVRNNKQLVLLLNG